MKYLEYKYMFNGSELGPVYFKKTLNLELYLKYLPLCIS